MNWKLFLWIFYLMLIAVVFFGAFNKLNYAKNAKSDIFYAKDLALTLNEVGSAKGKVTVEYEYFPDFYIAENCIYVKPTATACYIGGDKNFIVEKTETGAKIYG